MNEALLLPEIIATILQHGKSIEGLLFNSLVVNRLFFQEASRILWYGCGTDWNSATAGHVTPNIHHLGEIVGQDVNRAQIYANLIHVLQFRDEGEENEFADEARWHQELLHLQFPVLERVDLYPSKGAITMNTGEIILHYAQSNLKHLGFHAGHQIDNSFLDTLCGKCPRLRELILKPTKEITITKEEFAAFMKRTTALQDLQIGDAFKKVWTHQAFQAISTYQNLVLLHMHHIEDLWITGIGNETDSSAFPKLKYLHAGVSGAGLELLHPFMPKLRSLTLENEEQDPSHQILLSASRFTALATLKVQFGKNSSISGEELVHLAQNCPKLIALSISEDQAGACIPSGSGITDDLMNTFARKAPNLQDFCLLFGPRLPVTLHSPTFQSLHSLGRHCRGLEKLTFTCDINWVEVLQFSPKVVFPELWFLRLSGSHSLDTDDEEVIKKIARQLVSLAPKLMDFSFDEPTEVEELLEDAVTHICYGIVEIAYAGDIVDEESEGNDLEGEL